jgi:isopentenyl diphosphate isomerase/L-lactate dehydrogenase-like FMN-dependent dehydrogenase
MTYQEIRAKAKETIGPYCKVCPECNGVACRGVIPGPGGKGLGLGFIRNYQDLRALRLVMDTIYAPGNVSTATTLFGQSLSLPVFAAPIGAVGIHYGQSYIDVLYSKAVLEGCLAAGSAAFTGDGPDDTVYGGTVEAIRALGGRGVPTIKPWSLKAAIEKAKMAEDAGAFAFAMDIDAAGLTVLASMGKPVSPMPVESLRAIASSVRIPFILKGVMTPAGALKAIEAGARGIVVSNHGGRVLDETPSTMEVLPAIVEAAAGRVTVLIDGGFRTGLDVFKALALGANGVLIGRPFAWSVYGGGSDGARTYLEKVKGELADAMLMTGAKDVEAIGPSMVS